MRISDWSSDVCSSDLHFEHVADRCADGLLRVSLDHGVPVANGVLAVDEQEDAERRAGGSHGNKGEECALVALEMASLLGRSEEHTSELQSLMRNSYAVFCLKKQRHQYTR